MTSGNPPPIDGVVWLEEASFITMIASCIETNKKECCGLLLGYRSWSHWDKKRNIIVGQAYTFQNSERTRNSVTIPKEEKDCLDVLYKISMHEPLGYFHSHPDCSPQLSKKDVESMNLHDIEIVIALKEKGRNVPWRYNTEKKALSGVFGNHRFEISAFTLTSKTKATTKKLELFCPFALGIGSRAFDNQASPPVDD